MRLKVTLGIIFIATAAIVMPFGHWLNRGYYLVGFILAGFGGLLLARYFISRSKKDDLVSNDEIPLARGEAKGFCGACGSDNSEVSLNEDDAD